MSADVSALVQPIESGDLRLEPLADAHREALRKICPEDDEVWQIYPTHLAGADFDRTFDSIVASDNRRPFALFTQGVMVGASGYVNVEPANRALDIGGTYMTPSTRGTGLNSRIKPLLIERAFASGFNRIGFRIDARNLRSQRAVEKIGAVREGVLRHDMVTWTGHVRDTVVFSILKDEWNR